ncbi:MAG TPA: gamma-glutamyltransferase [Hyphomonadaceae bacterium]|nr:gamma-glutamyltransferase [Hyphomonadaceae bacterium]HPN04431.1 gamma-glutamyltransferase [Hyphomonadaceae bacterium]
MFASVRLFAVSVVALGVAVACTGPQEQAKPTGEAMVAAADPLAVEAGLEMLRAGGTAIDAAIAVEVTLGLVEPESSGIGGGGFLIHYTGASEKIDAYDGREWAPAGATPDMFMVDGKPLDFPLAQASGKSIGTPALIPMFKLVHEQHGKLPWAKLFEPAIKLAEEGFVVGPRLSKSFSDNKATLESDPEARALYLDASGKPWPQGHVFKNPAYAKTLRAIAADGPKAMTQGAIAEAIVSAAQRQPRAGTLTVADLQAFKPRRLDPLCGPYRIYQVCTMPSPSSANAMLSILSLYERARPQPVGPSNVQDWAAYVWASRLSYVDRDHYMGDDRFVEAPTKELIAPAYLDARAKLIDLSKGPAVMPVGTPKGEALRNKWGSEAMQEHGTTHLSVVDGYGNAVSLTATIESEYGSHRMAPGYGFWLNNQLTDFSLVPVIDGKPVANAVAPHKAPRSSMSPSIITDKDGELAMVAGSMGGSTIIASVSRTIIGVIDWKQTPQEAVGTSAVFARTPDIAVEASRMAPAMKNALKALGWKIVDEDLYSGTHVIQVTPNGLIGGADPREEGVAKSLPASN